MAAGQYKEAAASFRRAMAVEPGLSVAVLNLGRAAELAGQGEQLLTEAEAAMVERPADPQPYLLAGILHEKGGRPEKAMAVYEQAVTRIPGDWVFANNYAFLLGEQNASPADIKRAEALARRALELAPGRAAVLDTLGWLLVRQGKVTEAQGVLAGALSREPGNPVFNYHLAKALFGLGKKDQARERLAKALEVSDFAGRPEAAALLQSLGGG